MIYTDLNIDLSTQNFESVKAKQSDLGSRFLRISLENEGQEYIIPENAFITLNARKPDGTVTFTQGQVVENKIEVELTNQTLALAGRVPCDVSVFVDDKKLTSFTFRLDIERTVTSEEVIISTDEFSALTSALSEVKMVCKDKPDKPLTSTEGNIATLTADGNLLDGGASINDIRHEQADWDEADSQGKAFIKNKPFYNYIISKTLGEWELSADVLTPDRTLFHKIIPGEVYTFILDGDIGNPKQAIFEYENSGDVLMLEPYAIGDFLLEVTRGGIIALKIGGVLNDFTLSFSGNYNKINQINEKFLPLDDYKAVKTITAATKSEWSEKLSKVDADEADKIIVAKADGTIKTSTKELADLLEKVTLDKTNEIIIANSDGTVKTSGIKPSDKVDKVTGATVGNFATLDADGNLMDSGKSAIDFTAQTDFDTLENELDEIDFRVKLLEGVGIGDDIYGVEVDFENKTFTRIANSVGLTAGADFNKTPAFGGRKRCNLADDGTVNAYYGDAGYIENGTNGQVMVEQPKFYYKVIPLKLEKNNAVEITEFKFTSGASSNGNVIITLNGVAHNIAVTSGDTASDVGGKVRDFTFTGWATSGSGTTAILTKNAVGTVAAGTFNANGTGVAATITKIQIGYIGKGYILKKANFYLSMTKHAGFKLHPAFIKNNVEKDKIYLSAYEGSLFDVSTSTHILDDAQIADFAVSSGDKLSSIAGAKPISGYAQSLTRRNCGILAENRGAGWSQSYLATLSCSQYLFLIEYAAMNAQTEVGRGVVDKSSGTDNNAEVTGATTGLGNATGVAVGTDGLVSITYRGEENLWGNIWQFVDGVNVLVDGTVSEITNVYIADNSFAERKKTDNYVNAGFSIATRNGYFSAIAYNQDCDWCFLPAETLGDDTSPVGDSFLQTAGVNGYKTVLARGDWLGKKAAGLYSLRGEFAPEVASRLISGHLVYVPTT